MCRYDNFLVIGDLNSEISEMAMSEYCETRNLQNLVKDPTKVLTNTPVLIQSWQVSLNHSNTPKQSGLVYQAFIS